MRAACNLASYNTRVARLSYSGALLLAGLAMSCGTTENHPGGDAGGSVGQQGGTVATGGSAALGGNPQGGTATGGNSNPSGGMTGQGGTGTGGVATGGTAVSTGGTVATGGRATGGTATSTGGMTTGTGGIPGTGGRATGGMATSTGGMTISTGGTVATGGRATGGMAISTGGTVATGGRATGGMATSTGGNRATGGTSSGTTYTGKATYWTPNNAGACQYGSRYSGQHVAALNATQYGNTNAVSPNCGKCVDITGPNGTASKVIIIDACTTCANGDLDLDQATFQLLGPLSAGILSISWQFVAC
jgi:hypothetical protein